MVLSEGGTRSILYEAMSESEAMAKCGRLRSMVDIS